EQAGALKAFSPAYAVQVTPNLALGITLNIWTDKLFWSNGWEADTEHHAVAAEAGRQSVQFSSFTHDRYYGFRGWNLNLGFIWDVSEMLSIGAVVKTPFRAEMRHEQSFSATTRYANGTILHASNRLREDVDLEMPLSYGMGVALRWSDRLSFSCDVFRTEWSHFILEDGRRRRMSPITGMSSQDAHIKATYQVRLGAEYLVIFQKIIVPLRCGLFYDPEPSENNPEDYWGFSVGTGIPVGRMVFDIAYQFRRGADVEGEVIGVAQTSADVTQHLVLVSAIYHF
ncbi:MAG: hypothetical protein GY850_22685, partial [bacterium]|nr:hypothetical protein [bacterium]